MAKEQTHLLQVRAIMENMSMASLKEKVNTNGTMDKSTPETFWKERSMAKENGKAHNLFLIAINMRVIIKMIWKMEKVCSHGQVVTYTKENM